MDRNRNCKAIFRLSLGWTDPNVDKCLRKLRASMAGAEISTGPHLQWTILISPTWACLHQFDSGDPAFDMMMEGNQIRGIMLSQSQALP